MSGLKTGIFLFVLTCLIGLPMHAASPASPAGVTVAASAPLSNQSFAMPRTTATDPGRLQTAHLYNVSDDKGVLLSCIAPELETNADTDRFENCKLAPGRSLDELMHAIVGTIHYEQAQHEQERAAWVKQLEDMMDQKNDVASRK